MQWAGSQPEKDRQISGQGYLQYKGGLVTAAEAIEAPAMALTNVALTSPLHLKDAVRPGQPCLVSRGPRGRVVNHNDVVLSPTVVI